MRLLLNKLHENLRFLITGFSAFILSAGALMLFNNDDGGKTFLMLALLSASYYSFRSLNNPAWKQYSKGILFGLGTMLLLFLILQSVKAAITNAQWDFMCFYMQGLLGVYHLNFYNPDSFSIVLEKMNFHYEFSASFKSEILDVGFLSPPFTMLFFAPLASIDYKTSRIILSIISFFIVLVNIFIASKIFVEKQQRSIYSLLLILILTILLPGTNATISYNQTNFYILFFILLFIKYIDKPISGVFLALSLIIKPVSGILLLYLLLHKKWNTLLSFFATLFILVALTASIWGWHNVTGFFESPPTHRLPQSLYIQDINQSIIGLLNRNLSIYELPQSAIRLLYFLASGIILTITMFVSKRIVNFSKLLSFLVFIPCMLMVYPSSLSPYMILTIPLFVFFLFQKDSERYLWTMIIPALAFSRNYEFFLYLTSWIFIIYLTVNFRKIKAKTHSSNIEIFQ